jgi:hypothetical protein
MTAFSVLHQGRPMMYVKLLSYGPVFICYLQCTNCYISNINWLTPVSVDYVLIFIAKVDTDITIVVVKVQCFTSKSPQ